MKYAYAYDKGGKLARHFGVEGIPHAVLVDASGTVVWEGHPGELEEAKLQSALQGALPKPLWDWSPAAKGAKDALLKHSYKAALDQAAKLKESDGAADVLAAVQGVIKSRVDGLRQDFERGDFLGAQTTAQALQKDLAGLPELEEASKVLSAIAANKDAPRVIKGQQKVAKIRAADNSKKKELTAAIESLRKLRQEYPGTFVEKDADELITQLGARLGAMKDM